MARCSQRVDVADSCHDACFWPRLRLYGSLTAFAGGSFARSGNMETMRWLLLLLCARRLRVAFPATADAKVPCRNQVFNDW